MEIDEMSIEDVDDAWFWQLTEKGVYRSQICLPRNRFG